MMEFTVSQAQFGVTLAIRRIQSAKYRLAADPTSTALRTELEAARRDKETYQSIIDGSK